MDYINIPRSLIYKDRTDLKDFGVQIQGTMNCLLFSNLKELFMATDRAKELILRCFNNAYYICTLIPFQDFPETEVAEYENLLMKGDSYDLEEVCAVSMAMVCKLLPAYDARWRQEGNELIKNIHYRFTHYRWYHVGAAESFLRMVEKNNTDGLILTQSTFAPRDIIEVIDDISIRDLQIYAEYICERLAHLEDPHQRMYEADTVIAQIKNYQRELCEEYEYNPKKDSFEYVDYDPSLRDFTMEEKVRGYYKQSKKAIAYYTENYPYGDNNHSEKQTDSEVLINSNATLVAENELLRQQLAQQASQVNELTKDNAKLKEELAEFSVSVENLTANQKVRMAFALDLFKAAGLTDKMLAKRGNKAKVATVMSLLTGISSSKNKRGNDAQTCQTFLTDQKYYPRTQNIDILIRLNTLCTELGINVCLSLESQSNNKK